ncbi:MAG: hypothetical protein H6837_14395 [Planctomycetes bacterium]|nr:hypothetical protein [Planctomycetota bacterium]
MSELHPCSTRGDGAPAGPSDSVPQGRSVRTRGQRGGSGDYTGARTQVLQKKQVNLPSGSPTAPAPFTLSCLLAGGVRGSWSRSCERWGSGSSTLGIEVFSFHPGFPVDLRHNAKIDREKLAKWAAGRVRT